MENVDSPRNCRKLKFCAKIFSQKPECAQTERRSKFDEQSRNVAIACGAIGDDTGYYIYIGKRRSEFFYG